MSDESSFAPPPGERPARDDASEKQHGPRTSRDHPADDDGDRTGQRLLRPLGSLYALAQALTATEAQARRLVEATYERAGAASTGEQRQGRRWMLRLLVETAREQPDLDADANPEEIRVGEEDGPARPSGGRHLRERACEYFLHRALPAAFTALSSGRRLLLTLCEVEQLSLVDAAHVTGMSEDDVRHRLERARAELRRSLQQMAARPERALLDEALSGRRLRSALQRMADRDLAAPPPALRPAAQNALRHPPHTERFAPTEVSSTDAPDRRAASSSSSTTPIKRRLRRVLAALLIIGIAGGVGFLASALLEGAPEADLLAFSAEQADDVRPRLPTDRPERAEQYVRKKLGRRLQVPRIRGTALQGVGVAEVPSGASVPVLLFRDSASGQSIPTYVYNYALLKQAGSGGGLTLPPKLLHRLEQEGRFAERTIGDRRVLLWRHRDDIFAAVTARSDSLQQRIAFY